MRYIDIAVKGGELIKVLDAKSFPVILTDGSVNDICLRFTLSDEWSSFGSICAVFNGSGHIKTSLVTDNLCLLPWECTQKAGGEVALTLEGKQFDENGNIMRSMTTKRFTLGKIYDSDTIASDISVEPTPALANQILDEIAKFNDAEQIREVAESMRENAETARADAESARVYEESERDYAESLRVLAEVERADAESERVLAESKRENAEKEREANFATAITTAEDAAEAAENAAAKANNVNISAVQTETGATITVTDRDGVENTVHIEPITVGDSWVEVRNAVRLGQGSKLYPVGYEFNTHSDITNEDIVWVVVGHDHHQAANGKLKHTMTLEAKYAYSAGKYFMFDAAEALCYAADEIPAGTYNFTWDHDVGSMKTGAYQFTLTKAVPIGGQIVLGTTSSNTAITSCKISTYATVAAAEPIESDVAVTEGSEGTKLGAVSATTADNAMTTAKLNCASRVLWGSSNYAQSAVRQWLNSDAESGKVWTPSNVFDRAPSWAASRAGFINSLPDDFSAVVQPAVIPCRTNSVFEINSLDGTEYAVNEVYDLHDKFFLLSRGEVYGNWDSASLKDGELLEYYEDLTDIERIKYDAAGNGAYSCWLRTSYHGDAYTEYRVGNKDENGTLKSSYSINSVRVAPACIIA